jgi:hypothetical protein
MLINSIHKTLQELSDLLSQLSNVDYCSPCSGLSNATIGEHTRHIIEMFQCLENQYQEGIVEYDLRKGDYMIQTDTTFAKQAIAEIVLQLDKPNKELQLQQSLYGQTFSIASNYHRELLYNLEHCVHHQALIKVAVLQIEYLQIGDDFGVARSTIEYKKQCAQ